MVNYTDKIKKIMALAKDIDDKDLLDKVMLSLEKAKDYDEDDSGAEPQDDYSEYQDGEDEDAHQSDNPEDQEGMRVFDPDQEKEENLDADQPRYDKPVPAKIAPKAKNESQFPQPTKEDIAKLREYTRPWEQNARDTARLSAEAKSNPELHHQGHLIESRNKTLGDKNAEYGKFTDSPEYKNADPISQMEMDSKFHEDYNKRNPDHLKNALKEHGKAWDKGKKAEAIHAANKDQQIRHVMQGGAQAENPMSMEAAMQHAGGSKGEEGTTGSVVQDKAAGFAANNQDFLKDYAKNYNKKHVKPQSVEDMGEYDEAGKKDIARILGDNPALKDPKKKAHMDQFFSKFYPLIGMNASRTMSKLGLDSKKSDLDLGSMHEAGMHGLMQAINDYDHDHPSKASFATHASNKIRGLQQTALKAQDQIPHEVRAAAKKHQAQASQVQQPQASVQNQPPPESATAPAPAAPVFQAKTVRRVAGSHPPIRASAANDRMKRIDMHAASVGVADPMGHEPEEGEEE